MKSDYLDYECENDCCVDALARAFVNLRTAYDQLTESPLWEHEKVIEMILKSQDAIVDALAMCRLVAIRADKDRETQTEQRKGKTK